MALVSLNTIKNWFKTNLIPNQNQWWDVFDSFRHKSDKVASTDIDGLDNLLAAKASTSVLTTHTTAENAHAALFGQKVDKIAGKVLSDLNYSLPEKEKLAGLEAFVATQIAGAVVGSTSLGSITPASTIPATINVHGFAAAAGTYANCGGMVVPVNSIAFLARVGGVWTVSATTFSLSEYLDVINTLSSNETNKAGSANNDRLLNLKIESVFTSIKLVEQPNGFFLIDAAGYVIAKVTSEGVQSVRFLNKTGEDLEENIENVENSIEEISNNVRVLQLQDGFYFIDNLGYIIGKLTVDGFQCIDFLDKNGNSLATPIPTILTTLINGKQFYTIGDSLCAANLWQPKLAELTNSTFNAALNTSATLSVGGTRTGGVNVTCGQWRAKLLFNLNVNPQVIFIENINDANVVSSLGTINDEPFMLENIITYPSTFASLSALTTWLGDGSFATYLNTFATIDRKIGSGIRFPYTDGTTLFREYIFDSKIVANWATVSIWKYEFGGGMTIYKVYKGLLEYLKAKFPTALIMWFAPTRIGIQTVSGQPYYNATFWNADGSFNMTNYKAHSDSTNYETLVTAQKAVCEYYAIPFLDVNKECGINPFNFLTYYPVSDVHPLLLGYQKWGETIAKLL